MFAMVKVRKKKVVEHRVRKVEPTPARSVSNLTESERARGTLDHQFILS